MNLPFWRKLHVVMMMAGFTHGGIYTQNLHAGFTHDGGFYTRKLHAEITHGGGKYTWYHDPASRRTQIKVTDEILPEYLLPTIHDGQG